MSHSRDHYRRRYQRRIARGVCTKCTSRPPREGLRTCQHCDDLRKSRNAKTYARGRQLRAERKAKGLCEACGKRPIDEAVSVAKCNECLVRIREYARRTGYASTKKWFSKNKHRQKGYWKIGKDRLRREVFSHYGGSRCVCCGETILDFLSLDHIEGGGTRHRKSLKSKGTGFNFYRYLKQQGYPSGYRVLCHNCNKAVSHGRICPHQEHFDALADNLISAC